MRTWPAELWPDHAPLFVEFRPGEHPLALTDYECGELVALAERSKVDGTFNIGVLDVKRPDMEPVADICDEIYTAMLLANQQYWGFDTSLEWGVGLNVYRAGGYLKRHADTCPGMYGHLDLTTQLSAVVMLTDPAEYVGGDLIFPDVIGEPTASRERGTIVVFPAFVLHEVTPILSGHRLTANSSMHGRR